MRGWWKPATKNKPRTEAAADVPRWLPAALAAGLLLGGMGVQPAAAAPGAPLERGETLARTAKFLARVVSFHSRARVDALAALDASCTPGARQRFAEIGRDLWSVTREDASWSSFFATSVYALGHPLSSPLTVAFYHPFADVFLLTDWTFEADRARIVDAEIVRGDLLRQPPSVPPQVPPGWMARQLYAPAAVAAVTAESLRGFERVFAAAPTRGLRSALPGIEGTPAQPDESDRAVASGRLLHNLMAASEFRVADPEADAPLPALVTATRGLLDAMQTGRWQEVFGADDVTAPPIREAIRSLGQETLRSLRVVEYVLVPGGAVVFLVPSADSGYFLALGLGERKGAFRLLRLDPVNYDAAYRRLLEQGG